MTQAARISWKWKRLFSPDTPCLTVRNTFCQEYGLPKDACRLCMGGVEVADKSIGQVSFVDSGASAYWGRLTLVACSSRRCLQL